MWSGMQGQETTAVAVVGSFPFQNRPVHNKQLITDHSKQTTFATDLFITDPFITDNLHDGSVMNGSISTSLL